MFDHPYNGCDLWVIALPNVSKKQARSVSFQFDIKGGDPQHFGRSETGGE